MSDCLNCCPDLNNFLANDDFCGNFNFACGDSNFTVWNTDEVLPVGTVSVLYTHGCADALVVKVTSSFGDIDTFEVPLRNTRSRTYANLVSIELKCSGTGNNNCEGSYCVNLHYLV